MIIMQNGRNFSSIVPFMDALDRGVSCTLFMWRMRVMNATKRCSMRKSLVQWSRAAPEDDVQGLANAGGGVEDGAHELVDELRHDAVELVRLHLGDVHDCHSVTLMMTR